MAENLRERAYRTYLDFLESAEKKRRWTVFDDVPWEKLDASDATEDTARCVELFCAEELYVPDYSSAGLELVRSRFGLAWFQTRWAYAPGKRNVGRLQASKGKGARCGGQGAGGHIPSCRSG